jgi:hypothetical protein
MKTPTDASAFDKKSQVASGKDYKEQLVAKWTGCQNLLGYTFVRCSVNFVQSSFQKPVYVATSGFSKPCHDGPSGFQN